LRPVPIAELAQREAVEELHRIVEHAVVRMTVIVDGDGVRMREAARQLDFAFEALEPHAVGAGGRDELDGRRPAKQEVTRAIDHAHAALSQFLFERVVAELHGGLHLRAQAVDDP
jgi:hypothetical protein